jgi:hypothetical protein
MIRCSSHQQEWAMSEISGRAVEGTRLPRYYTPSLSSLLELIPPPIQGVGGQLMADEPGSIGMMHGLDGTRQVSPGMIR